MGRRGYQQFPQFVKLESGRVTPTDSQLNNEYTVIDDSLSGEYDMLDSEPHLNDDSKLGEYDILGSEYDSVECDVECQDNFNLKAGNRNTICQLDGNESVEDSLDGYDTDDEIDSEPIRAVLVPAQPQAGQQFSLEVGSDRV